MSLLTAIFLTVFLAALCLLIVLFCVCDEEMPHAEFMDTAALVAIVVAIVTGGGLLYAGLEFTLVSLNAQVWGW